MSRASPSQPRLSAPAAQFELTLPSECQPAFKEVLKDELRCGGSAHLKVGCHARPLPPEDTTQQNRTGVAEKQARPERRCASEVSD